jgi:hypothetical protein
MLQHFIVLFRQQMQQIIVILFSLKQILASKGDINLFQNGKRNPTVPKVAL